jgi:uncharacterized protein YjbI with pentapeptide repeats
VGKYPTMQATDLVKQIKAAKGGDPPVGEKEKTVQGKLDLTHLSLDVALIFEDCEFEDGVDLRYCEFKQAVKFCNCDFIEYFNSGDDTDSRTIYRKNLVCNDSTFFNAAKFRGLRCEGYALFRSATFCLKELQDPVYMGDLDRPPTDFTGATFAGGIDCEKAEFEGAVSFNLADCGVASFRGAKFLKEETLEDNTVKPRLDRPPANFTAATFRSLDCDGAEFKGAVSFRGVECGARASFQQAQFERAALLHDRIGTLPDEIGRTVPVDFTRASFGYLNALGASFKGAVSLNGLKCAGDVVLKNARFLRPERETLEEKEKELENRYGSCLALFKKELSGLLDSCPRKYVQLRDAFEQRLCDDIEEICNDSERRRRNFAASSWHGLVAISFRRACSDGRRGGPTS